MAPGHAEEDVDARRLDIGVGSVNALPDSAGITAVLAGVPNFPVPPRKLWMDTIVAKQSPSTPRAES